MSVSASLRPALRQLFLPLLVSYSSEGSGSPAAAAGLPILHYLLIISKLFSFQIISSASPIAPRCVILKIFCVSRVIEQNHHQMQTGQGSALTYDEGVGGLVWPG